MTQEALKLALEALELEEAQTHYPPQWLLRAITAIKEALAQSAEPVACAECERLRDALKRANGLAEHFERAWYLRGDEIELLKEQTEQEPVACCGYTDASAVKWNPFNNVVQCHNCGQVYTTPPQRTEQLKACVYCGQLVAKERNNGV